MQQRPARQPRHAIDGGESSLDGDNLLGDAGTLSCAAFLQNAFALR
jgi:hypothetical protein